MIEILSISKKLLSRHTVQSSRQSLRIQTAGRKMQNLISALSMILPDDGTVAVLMGDGAGTRLFPLTGGDHVEKIGTAPHHRVERLSEHS
jgi:hypothetical protein